MDINPKISLIVPIYMEEKYIKEFLNSLCMQTYPLEKMEIILIDGMSTDRTREIIKEFMKKHPNYDIRLLDNPNKYQVFALNLGIKQASGEIIVRLDAHSNFPPNYIELCVQTLLETGADNVGGLAITRGKSKFSQISAKMLNSKFGVGNSAFRTYAKSGYVETVPFGTYHKELFEKIGLFDERLIRNEDNEFNSRILKNGGEIYLNHDIRFEYYGRDNFFGLLKYAFSNGMWNIITLYLTKGSMRIRHFIPFFFFLYILIGGIVSTIIPKLLPYWLSFFFIYFILDVISTTILTKKPRDLLLLLLFPVFHVTYGVGSFIGLFKIIFHDWQEENGKN